MSRKVSDSVVRVIVRAAEAGQMTIVEIAVLVGLERHTVARVIRAEKKKRVVTQ